MPSASRPSPRRGEIWLVRLYIDPPGKGPRPVVIVSIDARNQNERANTVLAIPLTRSIHKAAPGLSEDSLPKAEDIIVLLKEDLIEPRSKLCQIGNARICQLGRAVQLAIACNPGS